MAITITEYLNSKEVKVSELDSLFKEVDSKYIDTMVDRRKCYFCEDKLNQETIPSESWTSVRYCRACKTINLILFADRMGGTSTDRIIFYKQK